LRFLKTSSFPPFCYSPLPTVGEQWRPGARPHAKEKRGANLPSQESGGPVQDQAASYAEFYMLKITWMISTMQQDEQRLSTNF
jgi:hypothetical protein